jgi:predicted acylesterase/phospholipase RssA
VQRPVIWNVGAIAASGHPGALDLFRRILLASAAIPALFPPVMVEVELEGRPYTEMHVDGGAVAQSFLYPSTLGDVMGRRRTVGLRERNAYVIRNSRLDPDWASVDRRIFTIAGRAIATMIHYSGHNDILRMQATAERDGVGFNLAYIGPDFTLERRESFDPDYMRALFDHGYRLARGGYRWRRSHPMRDAAPRSTQTALAR